MCVTRQDAAKQDCRIYRGDFGIPESLAGVHICEVVKETAVMRNFPCQETQGVVYAGTSVWKRNVVALAADAECRESEASCSDARHDVVLRLERSRPILHQPRLRIHLLHEIAKICLFQLFQECIVLGLKRSQHRRSGGAHGRSAGEGSVAKICEPQNGIARPAPASCVINSRRESLLPTPGNSND